MRQRNAQSCPAEVPNIPVTVQPGEVIDYPVLIVGFEEVVEDGPPAKTKKTSINEGPTTTPAA
jgi:hypothetical protein